MAKTSLSSVTESYCLSNILCFSAGARAHSLYRSPKKKGARALTLLGLADVQRKFRWVSDVRGASTGDGKIWHRSDLFDLISAGQWPPPGCATMCISNVQVPMYVLSDRALSLSHVIQKNFSGVESQLSVPRRIWNKFSNKSRMAIEQAWGELTSRFRFLRTTINWISED